MITWIINKIYKKNLENLPKISDTEQAALDAGDTWLEKSIFIGEPDWKKLSSIKNQLTQAEQDFIKNETSQLCDMLDEWKNHELGDLPQEIWDFIAKKGFLGLVIGKQYGGKGFSAKAHSDIIIKIASRSVGAAVTVMVPNSLGPGELITYYGTDEQKKYYLPRLALGQELPCFALTEPGAGSDATSIQAEAIVIEKKQNGKQILGLEITANKRWITLAPVATLIGLAVVLKDPNKLLAGTGNEGITCVLIPRDTENLEIGNRHLPSGQPFMNGTVKCNKVFIPIDNIIGGQKNAGMGWQMLVECLSIGRSISLPAVATASSVISYICSGAYTSIRRQFHTEINKFEGLQEKLAEIAGLSFLVDATRLLTLAAVDEHKKPSVASAIAKYYNTELDRKIVINAMDVHGGRTVVLGPRNYLINHYAAMPIIITVEGANIMTRNLLIFGQGAMACHPFVRKELAALLAKDQKAFTKLVMDHIKYTIKCFGSALSASWSRGYFIKVPDKNIKRTMQKLVHLSRVFAIIADLSLILLGDSLKRKERLSARLADALSYLYMAMAAIHRYQETKTIDHALHLRWATEYCYFHAENALWEYCKQFPNFFIGSILKFLFFPLGRLNHKPSDNLDHKLAVMMSDNNAYRQEIINNIHLCKNKEEAVEQVENTFQLLLKHKDLYQKIKTWYKQFNHPTAADLQDALANDIINKNEQEILLELENRRWDSVQVDAFSKDKIVV